MIFFREMKKHLSRMATTARPVGFAILAVIGAMLAGGLALAAEKTPTPKPRPAVVTPQGGINFGESTIPSPAAAHRAKLKWPEMTQKEIDVLTGLLKTLGSRPPVLIVCKDPMCEDLALNLDNVFESAKWKSEIVIGTQFGIAPGIHVSSKWLMEAFNGATGNRYGATVDGEKNADGDYILIGPKPKGGDR